MNRRIGAIAHFDAFMADCPRALAGWGRKPSGVRAQHWAQSWLGRRLGLESVLVEDGFLCSLEREGPRLSLLLDDLGVYYDASAPSRMERCIAEGVGPMAAARAQRLMALWRQGGLSKYNHTPDAPAALAGAPGRQGPIQQAPMRQASMGHVLVVDQCRGDMSIAGGLAGPGDFARMLDAALVEHPQATVVVKTHPDAHSHGRPGCFAPAALAHPRVVVIDQPCHPHQLIKQALAVYTVSSQIGFEALVHGVPVRCFGMPFYAGWGLSEDEMAPPARRGSACLASLAHAAFVALARYVDPVSGTPWRAEQAFAHAASWLAARRATGAAPGLAPNLAAGMAAGRSAPARRPLPAAPPEAAAWPALARGKALA